RNGARRARRHAGGAAHHRLPGDGRERAHPLLRGGGHRRDRLDQRRLLRRAPGGSRGHLREGAPARLRQRDGLCRDGRRPALAPARAARRGRRGPMRRQALLLAAAAALAAVAFSGDRFWLQFLGKAMIGCILAIGLDLLVGFTGMVSLAHSAFFGLAAAAALVIGWVSLRATGVYFIMVTLAFTQMLYYLFNDSPALGGSDGLYVQ